MFDNPEVPLDSLPSAAELDWQAMHPAFARCLQTKALLRWTIVAVAAGVATALRSVLDIPVALEIVLAGWAVILLIASRALIWPLLDVPRRGFVVRDKDIVYKGGVVWRSVKAVPYNRVQHAETASGLIDRRFGLARLTVFTAGGSGGDLRLDGLGGDVAERLRAHIVSRLGDQASPIDPGTVELG